MANDYMLSGRKNRPQGYAYDSFRSTRTMKQSKSVKNKPESPGPGYYNITHKVSSNEKNSRKFTIGLKFKKKEKESSPAPNRYFLNTSQTHCTKPKYGIGGNSAQRPSLVARSKLESPNPTAYYKTDYSSAMDAMNDKPHTRFGMKLIKPAPPSWTFGKIKND